MIEDILGWALLALIPLSFIAVVYGVKKFIKHRERKQVEAHKKMWAEVEAKAAVDREIERTRQHSIASGYIPPAKPRRRRAEEAAPVPSASTTPVSTWSDDLLTTAVATTLINAALSSISNASEPSSSNWGLDDNDSRKSASDSFSSSWSDSSSSSDSGPSSDW